MMIAPLRACPGPLRSPVNQRPHIGHFRQLQTANTPKDRASTSSLSAPQVDASYWLLPVDQHENSNKCSITTVRCNCAETSQNYVREFCDITGDIAQWGSENTQPHGHPLARETRFARVGRENRTAQRRWSKLLYASQGQPTAFASGLSTTRPPPSNTRLRRLRIDPVTLRVDNCSHAPPTVSQTWCGYAVPIAARISGVFTDGERHSSGKSAIRVAD
jgi:hypothetical protein